MIIAPRNIGMSVPAMTPMVAIAPTTPPRIAVDHPAAGVADQDRQQVGDHRADDAAAGEVAPAADLGHPAARVPQPGKMAGSQPALMNRAVIRPQAMNAPMLGMTMFDSAVPNF